MSHAIPNPFADQLDRYRSIVPDWESFLDALRRPLPLCLWTNVLRTTPALLADWLESERIEVRRLPWHGTAFRAATSERAGQTISFVAGLYHVQEEVSILPVILLDPKPGERVLDMCAAPGSKSAQIAVAMRNHGTLISNDRSGLRHRATRGTLDRLGIVNTTITIHNAATYPQNTGLFDRILADVPCTCEGTSRKNYDAFKNSGPEAARRIAVSQLAILTRALELCRPGGRVVYATCTYAPEENEEVVDAALRTFADDVDVLPARISGFESSPGITRWNGRTLDPRLHRSMRVWPHQNDTGGFFIAVLERIGRVNGRRDAGAVPTQKHTENHQASGCGAGLSSDGGDEVFLHPQAQSAWFALLQDRFGFPDEAFDALRLARTSEKYVMVVSSDHVVPACPEPVSVGTPFIRTQLQYPKLTTTGTMLLGMNATRNVVEATADQARRYLARKDFLLAFDQLDDITDTGYVIVRLRGVSLGVGLCYLDERRVLSMYPKLFSRALTEEEIPGSDAAG